MRGALAQCHTVGLAGAADVVVGDVGDVPGSNVSLPLMPKAWVARPAALHCARRRLQICGTARLTPHGRVQF